MTTWWKSRVPCPDCGVLVSISAEGCFCLNEVCERVWIPNPYMAELDAAHVQETARAALAAVPPTRKAGAVTVQQDVETVRESLGIREWAASITPSEYGKKVEDEIPEACAALARLASLAEQAEFNRDGCVKWAERAQAAEAQAERLRDTQPLRRLIEQHTTSPRPWKLIFDRGSGKDFQGRPCGGVIKPDTIRIVDADNRLLVRIQADPEQTLKPEDMQLIVACVNALSETGGTK